MMQQVKRQPIDSQLVSLASVNSMTRAPDAVVVLKAGVGEPGESWGFGAVLTQLSCGALYSASDWIYGDSPGLSRNFV